MVINVREMTEEAYMTLQRNYKDVYKEILKHPSDSSWLKDYLDGIELYREKTYTIEDFELQCSDNYDDVKTENAITIYEHLKDLPRYVVCNNRFWAWIIFEKAYRQAIASVKIDKAEIIKNWWLEDASKRSLMLNVISRHFFEVEVSIDEDAADKYYLTRYLFSSVDEQYRNIAYRNIGMLKNVTLAYIEAQKDFEEISKTKSTKLLARQLFKETSKLGSVRLIDTMDRNDIYNYLLEKLEAKVAL